jgi:large subunit ribosomal protein L25
MAVLRIEIMSEFRTIDAELRGDVGKGASRRLRHQGKIPAILYGGKKDPVALELNQNEILHATENEAFFASILEIKVGDGRTQQAVIRDMHRHPYRHMIMHIDFMRVSGEEVLRIAVPIHFVGEEDSPAGRTSGVVIQHQMTDVEIDALPKDLPEYIVADLSEMDAGGVIVLSDLKLPEGVEIPALAMGEEHDSTVANAIHIKEDQGTGAAAAAEAEAAAADELGEIGDEALAVEEGEEGDAPGEEEGTPGESGEDQPG